MGFSHIAIGGLLRRFENTVRYTQVRNEAFMYDVLEMVRKKHPRDWLFALGAFHPNRLTEFQRLDVWGDYKGWIFQYKKRNETLNRYITTLTTNHFEHLDNKDLERKLSALRKLIETRHQQSKNQEKNSHKLLQGRRKLASKRKRR